MINPVLATHQGGGITSARMLSVAGFNQHVSAVVDPHFPWQLTALGNPTMCTISNRQTRQLLLKTYQIGKQVSFC